MLTNINNLTPFHIIEDASAQQCAFFDSHMADSILEQQLPAVSCAAGAGWEDKRWAEVRRGWAGRAIEYVILIGRKKDVIYFIKYLCMISKVFNRTLNRGLTLNIKRYFDLHEYQSKDLMRKFHINVQRGATATTPEEAYQVAKDLDVKGGDLILKAQVHAGGRGKGTNPSIQELLPAASREVSRSLRLQKKCKSSRSR